MSNDVLCLVGSILLAVIIKSRPPIFEKKIENEKNNEKFKGNFQLYREIQV